MADRLATHAVKVSTVAVCTLPEQEGHCGWTETGQRADREAERHTRLAGHPTATRTTVDRTPEGRPTA